MLLSSLELPPPPPLLLPPDEGLETPSATIISSTSTFVSIFIPSAFASNSFTVPEPVISIFASATILSTVIPL